MFSQLASSLRVALFTLLVCGGVYSLALLAFARGVVPDKADASLVRDAKGQVVGSSLLGQGFSSPKYFWPRPSAVNYDAAAAGGSNLSSASPKLRARALATLVQFAGAAQVPADLVAASGSGLDPHISLAAALFQAERVAQARGVPVDAVVKLVEARAERPGPLVNVLLLNLALDRGGE